MARALAVCSCTAAAQPSLAGEARERAVCYPGVVIFYWNRLSLSHSLGRGPVRVRPSTWRYAVCPQALPLRGLPSAQLGRYLPCGCVRQSICSGTWPLSPLPPPGPPTIYLICLSESVLAEPCLD